MTGEGFIELSMAVEQPLCVNIARGSPICERRSDGEYQPGGDTAL